MMKWSSKKAGRYARLLVRETPPRIRRMFLLMMGMLFFGLVARLLEAIGLELGWRIALGLMGVVAFVFILDISIAMAYILKAVSCFRRALDLQPDLRRAVDAGDMAAFERISEEERSLLRKGDHWCAVADGRKRRGACTSSP